MNFIVSILYMAFSAVIGIIALLLVQGGKDDWYE